MRINPSWLRILAAGCCGLLLLAGCKKNNSANSAKEPPITGKPSDAPVAVAPTWKPGNRYVMRLERTQSTSLGGLARMGMGGGGPNANAPMETTYAQEYAVTVTNAADGSRAAELEILGIELQVGRGDEQWINYDSQNKAVTRGPASPTYAVTEALDKLIGGKVSYRFSADNKVSKVEGVNELIARVDGAGTAGAGRRGGRGMGGLLRTSFNEDVFKQMVDLSGAPPKEVHVGETWIVTRDINPPMIGKLTVTVTNRLRGWQDHDGVKCARVEFTGGIGSKASQPGPFGGQVSISDGTIAGHYWYDPAISLAREMQSQQSFKVTATMGARQRNNSTNSPAGTNAAPQTFTTPVSESSSVKLIEVKRTGES